MVRDENLAREIINSLGEEAVSMREIIGKGEVNHVFVATTKQDPWVVRFELDELGTDDYSKEAWCLSAAKANGIPTPELVSVGNLDSIPFIVQGFIDGDSGNEHRSPELWTSLGKLSRTINEISLPEDTPSSLFPRFGRDLHQNWINHVRYNVDQLNGEDQLLELGVYPLEMQGQIRSVFNGLTDEIDTFGLTHGDLVPKNTLVTASGSIVVLDWGSAGTAAAPHHDIMRIWQDEANEGFSACDLHAFADGYGVDLDAVIPTLRSLQLLSAVDVVRWSIDQRPDRTPHYAKRANEIFNRLKIT